MGGYVNICVKMGGYPGSAKARRGIEWHYGLATNKCQKPNRLMLGYRLYL